jgi:hypothetical protein
VRTANQSYCVFEIGRYHSFSLIGLKATRDFRFQPSGFRRFVPTGSEQNPAGGRLAVTPLAARWNPKYRESDKIQARALTYTILSIPMVGQWQNCLMAASWILSGAGISNRWQFHCLANSGGRHHKAASSTNLKTSPKGRV